MQILVITYRQCAPKLIRLVISNFVIFWNISKKNCGKVAVTSILSNIHIIFVQFHIFTCLSAVNGNVILNFLFSLQGTHQECSSVIMLNVGEHLTLLLTWGITCAHTLERNLMLALMKGVAETLRHRVTFVITSVPTVEKELSNVNIPVVIVCLHGQHIWNITWKLTQETEHTTVLMKDATRVFTSCSD